MKKMVLFYIDWMNGGGVPWIWNVVVGKRGRPRMLCYPPPVRHACNLPIPDISATATARQISHQHLRYGGGMMDNPVLWIDPLQLPPPPSPPPPLFFGKDGNLINSIHLLCIPSYLSNKSSQCEKCVFAECAKPPPPRQPPLPNAKTTHKTKKELFNPFSLPVYP